MKQTIADSDKITVTAGEFRRAVRMGDQIREGYSIDAHNAEREAEVFRDWALELERQILRDHPAGKGVCPGCGKQRACPSRRAALRTRRESIEEWEARNAAVAEERLRHATNVAQSLRLTKPRSE